MNENNSGNMEINVEEEATDSTTAGGNADNAENTTNEQTHEQPNNENVSAIEESEAVAPTEDVETGAEVAIAENNAVANGDIPEAPAEAEQDVAPFYGFEEVVETEPTFDDKDMTQVLQIWDSKRTQSGYDPVPVLKRLAEIFESETDIYMRKDPDPLDERHPYRTDPSCQFGFLLKQLFRKENFMNKLVNDYLRDNYFTRQNLQKSALELNILACRLILVIMPGLETSAVFQVEYDTLIHRIYSWAEDSIEPLQSYATGLLAAAMEVSDIAVTFRELNTRLVPKMIKRLHMLQAMYKTSKETQQTTASADSSFNTTDGLSRILPNWLSGSSAPESPTRPDENITGGSARTTNFADAFASNSNFSTLFENSRDAFASGGMARYYKKTYIPIHPPTAESSQMLIMRYLTSMGEYQEFLGLVFEHNVMQLIFGYIDNLDRYDTCLAFEALKYLASLLCHKKFALEFIAHGGLELLLKVPRPSIASTGVSITLYYLAYSEDAMERICTMPSPIITELVRYALWILGRSYDSGKCHATMFFGLSFQFKVILDEFDAQDGLRKMYNVISILKILNPTNNNDEDQTPINEDVECASRQLVRHVCVALERYMESHLFFKYNNFIRQQCPTTSEFGQSLSVASKSNLEQISEQIRTLQENNTVRGHWEPVDNLLKLGGITLLLKIIAFSYDWNNAGRSETVRSALDVLSICCVTPKVFEAFCDRLELPDNIATSGIYSILGAAAGDITADADVQKSALAVLCHCVCAPLTPKTELTNVVKTSTAKRAKLSVKYPDWLIENVWESVCSNNGIIVLLSLMQIKMPITDADCIRGMACRALAGLARSERVRQIVGKLPLFASGQIQTLMRDPILQEKRAEHVIFQKYALELLERVSGKTKPISNQLEASLANIHKANVVAQTKIQYNEQQLLQLIYDHLESKGMSQTAGMLQKEAGLQVPTTVTKNFHQSPFDYKVLPTSSLARNRLRNRMQDVNMAINSAPGPGGGGAVGELMPYQNLNGSLGEDAFGATLNTPIKIVRKADKSSAGSASSSSIATNAFSSSSSSQRSLQKQITSDVNIHEDCNSPNPTNAGITLSTIVTEYLTNQHALCKNPMSTCPQFDLFTPHKCPDPKPNRLLGANINITSRIFRAQAGYSTSQLDRRFIHSNFAPWRTIRSIDYNDNQFTCCNIVHSSNLIVVGMEQGEVKAFNINDGTEQFSSICHSYLIDSIKSNRAGDLVVTSSSWRSPLSVLWCIRNNEFESKLRFKEEFYCEFSNQVQDKILGTQNDCAIIYDINKGTKVSTFTPSIGNQYTKNRATFNPTDEIILSDGVLWDVRSGKEIHKFDKLNQSLSGVFHPNGLEIISNTEVWDLRTFHLLQTVPILDQSHIKFSPLNVMYGFSLDNENRSDLFEEQTTYDTSFKVLDAYDYTSISTIDVKRHINDLSINGNGSLISMVEYQLPYSSKQETFVKIYAVGMKKGEQQEEEDEEEDDDPDTDGNSEDGVIMNFMSPAGHRLADRMSRRRQRIEAQFEIEEDSEDEEDGDDDNDDADDDDDDDDDDEDDGGDGDDDDDDDGSEWINISTTSDGDNSSDMGDFNVMEVNDSDDPMNGDGFNNA